MQGCTSEGAASHYPHPHPTVLLHEGRAGSEERSVTFDLDLDLINRYEYSRINSLIDLIHCCWKIDTSNFILFTWFLLR
jgi:hypothetical protein